MGRSITKQLLHLLRNTKQSVLFVRSIVYKTILYAFIGLVIGIANIQAQSNISQVTVPVDLLKKHLYTLASDSLEGRQTGTPGQYKAAVYCTQSFRLSHLLSVFRVDSVRGSFRQVYTFTESEVAMFGNARGYGGSPATFKRYELTPPPLPGENNRHVRYGHNVAGLLLGTDLKQEIVVMSAHYDHLGRNGGRIFYGADDNASGTATILSIAAVFDSLARQGIRSRRSILFVLFSGEEAGMLGSQFFIYNSPIPKQQYVCDLNVDMVGRVDAPHRKKPDYCYIIAGKKDDTLRKTVELANRQSVNLLLDYEHDSEYDPKQYFYRSDQYSFAKFGIPILFFLNGDHPDHHQPTDTADKIVYEVLQKRATLVFQTAWRVANPDY